MWTCKYVILYGRDELPMTCPKSAVAGGDFCEEHQRMITEVEKLDLEVQRTVRAKLAKD